MAKLKETNMVLKSNLNYFPNKVELHKECVNFEEAFSEVVNMRSKKDGNCYWIGNITFYNKNTKETQ